MGIIYTSTCKIYYEDEIRYLKHLEYQGTCVTQELTHLELKGILQKPLFPHSHWTEGETEKGLSKASQWEIEKETTAPGSYLSGCLPR